MKAIIKRQKLGDKGCIVLSDDSGKETKIIADILEVEVADFEGLIPMRRLEFWQLERYYRVAIETERLLKIYGDLKKSCEQI